MAVNTAPDLSDARQPQKEHSDTDCQHHQLSVAPQTVRILFYDGSDNNFHLAELVMTTQQGQYFTVPARRKKACNPRGGEARRTET